MAVVDAVDSGVRHLEERSCILPAQGSNSAEADVESEHDDPDADGSQNKAKRKLGTIGDAHVKGISRYFGCLYLIRVLIK